MTGIFSISDIRFAFGLLSVFKKRFFCRFICPTGLLVEGISHIGLKKLSWWSRWPPIGQYAAVLTLAGAFLTLLSGMYVFYREKRERRRR